MDQMPKPMAMELPISHRTAERPDALETRLAMFQY
jgi:hypothetical protein